MSNFLSQLLYPRHYTKSFKYSLKTQEIIKCIVENDELLIDLKTNGRLSNQQVRSIIR